VLVKHLEWVAERVDQAVADAAEPEQELHPIPGSENFIG